jgi:hypothetical protein
MVLDQHPASAMAIGVTLFAGLTTFCATFVFGPFAYSPRSWQALVVRVLLLLLCIGLFVVGKAAVQTILVWPTDAA